MIRYMCGVSMKIEGQMKNREDWLELKKCMEFRIEVRRPVGRPRRPW